MDKDRIAGSIKVIAGRAKEAVGKLVGDGKLEANGAAEKTTGKIQNAIGGAKDTIRESVKSVMFATTILAGSMIAAAPITAVAQGEIGISVQIAPPILPTYNQPPIPAEGYIWTPGYWQWAQQGGYYWVPGTWIQPPSVGMLWTPPYWAWGAGAYLFHAGYWGPHVGFYGGVNYGFGYGGVGYQGGHWDNSKFVYNQTVNNFGAVHVTNVYRANVTVANHTKVSYAGGTHGLKTQPTAPEGVAEHEQHAPVTADQARHVAAAASSPALAASHNKGRPAIAATSRPAEFSGPGVVRAKPASVAQHAAPHPAAAAAPAHPAERVPVAQNTAAPRPAAPSAAAPAHAPATEPRKEDRPER